MRAICARLWKKQESRTRQISRLVKTFLLYFHKTRYHPQSLFIDFVKIRFWLHTFSKWMVRVVWTRTRGSQSLARETAQYVSSKLCPYNSEKLRPTFEVIFFRTIVTVYRLVQMASCFLCLLTDIAAHVCTPLCNRQKSLGREPAPW